MEEWANPFRIGSQCYRLLEAFRDGKHIFNWQIVKVLHILNYTGRISELRAKGFNIVPTKLHGGVVAYQLIK